MSDAERIKALTEAITARIEESHRILEETIRTEQITLRRAEALRDAYQGKLSALVDAAEPVLDALWETGHPRAADVRIFGEVVKEAKDVLHRPPGEEVSP